MKQPKLTSPAHHLLDVTMQLLLLFISPSPPPERERPTPKPSNSVRHKENGGSDRKKKVLLSEGPEKDPTTDDQLIEGANAKLWLLS